MCFVSHLNVVLFHKGAFGLKTQDPFVIVHQKRSRELQFQKQLIEFFSDWTHFSYLTNKIQLEEVPILWGTFLSEDYRIVF